MTWKSSKTPMMMLVMALGVAVFLFGFVGEFVTFGVSLVLAFIVWIVGALTVNALMR